MYIFKYFWWWVHIQSWLMMGRDSTFGQKGTDTNLVSISGEMMRDFCWLYRVGEKTDNLAQWKTSSLLESFIVSVIKITNKVRNEQRLEMTKLYFSSPTIQRMITSLQRSMKTEFITWLSKEDGSPRVNQEFCNTLLCDS